MLVTKATLRDSNTAWAQGGIAVALDIGDSPALHAADTIAASDGLADPLAVDVLVNDGPARVRELLELGARYDRGPDGELRFGLEDGQSRTLEEVGRQFGVTRERIRQIESKTLAKLRHPHRSQKLRDYLDSE